MLALGIAAIGALVALDLRREAQSRPPLGDLSPCEPVAAEEAFLGSQVKAVTRRLAERDDTEVHTRRGALRSVQVGEALGLTPERLRVLAAGGPASRHGQALRPGRDPQEARVPQRGRVRGRHGDQLDLETRIIGACDVYDALISPRVYRGAWTHEQALGFLHEHAGTVFDARVVAALEHVLGRDRPHLAIAV